MKRLLPVATVLVALLLPGSAFALSTGYYTGSNSQGLPLKFQVIKKSKKVGKKRVYTYYAKLSGPFTTTRITCPDGYKVDFKLSTSPPLQAKISAKGKFSFNLPRGGYPLKFSGTVVQGRRSSSASGKLSNVLNGETHGATCTSGDLTWTTHHV